MAKVKVVQVTSISRGGAKKKLWVKSQGFWIYPSNNSWCFGEFGESQRLNSCLGKSSLIIPRDTFKTGYPQDFDEYQEITSEVEKSLLLLGLPHIPDFTEEKRQFRINTATIIAVLVMLTMAVLVTHFNGWPV